MFAVKYFIIFAVSAAAYSQNISDLNYKLLLGETKKPVNPIFVKAVNSLIKLALNNYYQTMYFVQSVDDEKDEYIQNLLTELLIANNKKFVHRLDNTDISPIIRYVRQNSVFIIDNIENFYIVNKTITPVIYRLDGNFLFVLVEGYFEQIGKIFSTLWKKDIYRAFAIYEQNGEIILSTFMPFSNSSCGSTKPLVLAKFENGTFDTKILFARRAVNLQKCPIRISTYIDPYYINIRKVKNSSDELYGPGVNLMNTLSESLNYTNEITIDEGELPWGVIFPNGTITGSLGDLQKNISDMAISEYYMKPDRSLYFDASATQYTTQMVFIIPPGERFKTIEKMLQPFHYFVWIILIITISIAVLIVLTINIRIKKLKSFVYGYGVKTPMTNILLVLLGLQQTRLPGRNFSRFMLMMFVILCLVLRSIYQGSLYQFLQSDKRHKEVQSIEEMIKKDFTFYMYESALDLFTNHSDIIKRTKLINSPRNMFLDIELNGDEKVASLDSMLTIQFEINNGSNIRYLKESLITFNVVIYYRKNFFLRYEIDKILNNLISGGIIDYWNRDYKKIDPQKKIKGEPRKLTLYDLQGPFNLLTAGLVAASISFVLEVLISKILPKITSK